MDVEALGIRRQALGEFRQFRAGDAGGLLVVGIVAASEVVIPVFGKIAHHRLLGELRGGFLRGLEITLDDGGLIRDIFDADSLGVNLIQRGMFFDRLVHQRLRDGGVIDFAVTMTAITDEIHDNVVAEFVTVFGGDPGDAHHGIDIFAIHMKDRDGLAAGELRREAR